MQCVFLRPAAAQAQPTQLATGACAETAEPEQPPVSRENCVGDGVRWDEAKQACVPDAALAAAANTTGLFALLGLPREFVVVDQVQAYLQIVDFLS